MIDNVMIRHLPGDGTEEERSTHNVWTHAGQEWLANFLSVANYNSSPTPQISDVLTAVETRRIRYLGVGVGSVRQDSSSLSGSLATQYPAGSAPRKLSPDYLAGAFTAGNEYNHQSPTHPRIETLERPVRVSGGTTPYPGVITDIWSVDVLHTHRNKRNVTVHATLDGGSHLIYGGVTSVPITEAALLLSGSKNTPYSLAIAYVCFPTLIFTAASRVKFTWSLTLE